MRRKVIGTRQLVLLTLVAVGSVVAVVAAAGPATAHNALISTHPADHQQVSRTPAAVVLTFNEPALAMGTHLVITGPSGPVQQGPAQLVDTTVSQALQGGAPAGEYIVAWRVTSADGHPISGRFAFTADQPGGGAASTASPSPVSTEPTRTSTSTWPCWVAALTAVGAVGALTLVGLRRDRRGRRDDGT